MSLALLYSIMPGSVRQCWIQKASHRIPCQINAKEHKAHGNAWKRPKSNKRYSGRRIRHLRMLDPPLRAGDRSPHPTAIEALTCAAERRERFSRIETLLADHLPLFLLGQDRREVHCLLRR